MKDPRAIAAGAGTWLTDSRVYNLIWLGRWLERGYAVLRDVEIAAQSAADEADFATRLASAAGAWSVETDLGARALLTAFGELTEACLTNARNDAGQVGPLELIEELNSLIDDLPGMLPADVSADAVGLAYARITARLNGISAVVEERWFHALPG